MVHRKLPAPILMCGLLSLVLFLSACAYIVMPERNAASAGVDNGWRGLATNVVETSSGDLQIELTIRNETSDWSAMQVEPGKPVTLTASDGKPTTCEGVHVSSGGHRLAPGFQMRGYITGTKAEPEIQLIGVECKGVKPGQGMKLSIPYTYVKGEYNYYYPEENKGKGTMEVSLDEVAADLVYPIGEPIDGLVQPSSTAITAINNVVLTLAGVERTENGLHFTWSTQNPGEYPSYVHIGNPPVIGADGILYGYYETPDLASVPVTPGGEQAEWTTDVSVPAEGTGFYIMLSVESKKQRLFTNYAIDISDR